MSCPFCGAEPLELAFLYEEPPAGETRFGLSPEEYRREYLRCPRCGHYLARLAIPVERIYTGAYVDATYDSAAGLERTYRRIMELPPERSDNLQRVARIVGRLGTSGRLLDVGSGLGVFPARMSERGWQVTALDPDARAGEHARSVVGVEAVCADFLEADGLGRFDLVTLNKVLEHVPDPVAMLARARDFVNPDGTVYVEVPDGEGAAADPDGPGREEFFIEHLHVFSERSLRLLAERAGFEVAVAERLREPSGKYTLVAFLAPSSATGRRRASSAAATSWREMS
ncbi:MAG: class I SAM-dependent methyltransferase, partial [Thermoleophilaceae bacterium]